MFLSEHHHGIYGKGVTALVYVHGFESQHLLSIRTVFTGYNYIWESQKGRRKYLYDPLVLVENNMLL